MNIETLQIKRVTGHWDDHKGYIPPKGEYVLIDIEGHPKTLVLGESTTTESGTTLEQLLTKDSCIIPFKSNIAGIIDMKLDEVRPDNNTNNISADSSDRGSSRKFAYSDHTHKIEKDTITSVLKDTNDFGYHGIKVSTRVPDETTPGNVGDILIVYEDK